MADPSKSINIRVLAEKTMKDLTALQRQQFPYALAKTLTDLALGSQEIVRIRTRALFETKSEFIPKGIKIRPGRKAEVKAGRGRSEVFTMPLISAFMSIHETGGTRQPAVKSGGEDRGKALTVPALALMAKSYRTRTGRVKKSYQPTTLFQKRGGRLSQAFVLKGQDSGVPIVARRLTRKRYPLEILYIFSKRTTYKPVWEFEESVEKHVMRQYTRVFDRNLKAAMATAH